MATLKKFEELEIWKDAIKLSKEIYVLTQKEIFKMWIERLTNSKLRKQ